MHRARERERGRERDGERERGGVGWWEGGSETEGKREKCRKQSVTESSILH